MAGRSILSRRQFSNLIDVPACILAAYPNSTQIIAHRNSSVSVMRLINYTGPVDDSSIQVIVLDARKMGKIEVIFRSAIIIVCILPVKVILIVHNLPIS